MTPANFKQANTTFAKNQPQYRPLPAHVGGTPVAVTTCWCLTWRERLRLLFTGRLWLQQLTFGERLQPQLPHVRCPL